MRRHVQLVPLLLMSAVVAAIPGVQTIVEAQVGPRRVFLPSIQTQRTEGSTQGITTRVSVGPDGSPGFDASNEPAISGDGRFVAFTSYAYNFVADDTNDQADVFVRDQETGQMSRVSIASDGTQGNSFSLDPAISADGRFVAFRSDATSLVPNDTNGFQDIFVHDRQTGQTSRVSVASDGSEAKAEAEFEAESYAPALSTDGRFVTFSSSANNLVPDDTNSSTDVFVHDQQTGQTSRVSVASDGSQADGGSARSRISADGRLVAFSSSANNLISGDTNGRRDVFVHDRQTSQTSRISVASDGSQADTDSFGHAISADGRFVIFSSEATNLGAGGRNELADVFLHDRETGQTSLISVTFDGSEADNSSTFSSISGDGRFVAFVSGANNLVADDTNGERDVFVHDRQTSRITRVSVASDGTEGDDDSGFPVISADGRFVAFTSSARNLVANDGNFSEDVFVHDRGSQP